MARDEADREDLLREATALVERIELAPVSKAPEAGIAAQASGNDEHIVAGFRAGGALSIFFGSDPVYQFNDAGELRRAYVNGLLFKATRGRLVSMERQRSNNEVLLCSRELAADVQTAFIEAMHQRLRQFRASIEAAGVRVTGQVPAEADVLSRLRLWLGSHEQTPIAESPRV